MGEDKEEEENMGKQGGREIRRRKTGEIRGRESRIRKPGEIRGKQGRRERRRRRRKTGEIWRKRKGENGRYSVSENQAIKCFCW